MTDPYIPSPTLRAVAGELIEANKYNAQVAEIAAAVNERQWVGSSAYAGLPISGQAGRTRYVTDRERGLWLDNGSRWRSLLPEINLLDFDGADPTGAADSSAAFVAADAAAVALGGAAIVVPAGEYLANWSLTGRSHWRGEGKGVTTILPYDPVVPVVTSLAAAYGSSLGGMTLDGNTTGDIGILFLDQGGIRFALSDLEVTRFQGTNGFGITNLDTTPGSENRAYSMQWNDVHVTYCKKGVYLTDAFSNLQAYGCKFWYSTEHQLYLTRGSDSRVAGIGFYGTEIENSDRIGCVGLYANGVKGFLFAGYHEAQPDLTDPSGNPIAVPTATQLVYDLVDSVGAISGYANGGSGSYHADYCLRLASSIVTLETFFFTGFGQVHPWNMTDATSRLSMDSVDLATGVERTGLNLAMQGGNISVTQVGATQLGIQQPDSAADSDTLVHVWEKNADARGRDGQIRVYGNEAAGKTRFAYLMHTGDAVDPVGIVAAFTGALSLRGGNVERLKLSAADPGSGEAGLLIQVNDGSVTSVRQVYVGPPDGSGHRALYVL